MIRPTATSSRSEACGRNSRLYTSLVSTLAHHVASPLSVDMVAENMATITSPNMPAGSSLRSMSG